MDRPEASEQFVVPGPKTINISRACLGAQLTICAQKCRNFVCSSIVSLRFVLSRVCVFLYSLGPWSNEEDSRLSSSNSDSNLSLVICGNRCSKANLKGNILLYDE